MMFYRQNHPYRVGRAVLILFLVLLAVQTACTRTGKTIQEGNSAREVLKVGITSDSPPLIYRHKGEVTGLEAELAGELARFAGRKLRFVEVGWDEQIPSLLAGKTDIIMSGMTITDLRRMRIEFTRPYLATGQIPLVRRKEYNRFSNGLSDLLNPTVRIGAVQGTTGDYLVRDTVAAGSSMQFNKADEAVAALLDGSIDVFVYDLPMNLYLGSLNESRGLVPVTVPLSREFLAWGVRREDAELLNTANRFIEELQQDKRLQAAIRKWIPFYRNFLDQQD